MRRSTSQHTITWHKTDRERVIRLLLILSILIGIAGYFPRTDFSQNSPDASADYQFERLGPFGGEVRSLLIDAQRPQIAYLGTSGGQIYKSLDGGNSWNQLGSGIGRKQYVVDALIQHPEDPDRIYAGTWDLHSVGGGLFESRDGGLAWKPVHLSDSDVAVRSVAICKSEPNFMLAGTYSGAFFSKDGGSHWRKVGPDSGEFDKIESVAIDPNNPALLFVGTWRLGYRSGDFGKTWTRVGSGMIFDSHIFSISISDKMRGVVYAGACSGIYRSVNHAASWKRLKVLPGRSGVRTQVVYFDPLDSRRIFGGTTEGLFMSRDGGESWSRITSPQISISAVQVNPTDNNKILIATDNRGVFRSQDGGKTWADSNNGFAHRRITQLLRDPFSLGDSYTGALADDAESGFFLFDGRSGKWVSVDANSIPLTQVTAFLTLPGEMGRLAGTPRGLHVQKSPSQKWTRLAGWISNRKVYDLKLDHSQKWVFAGTDEGIYRARIEDLSFRPAPANNIRPIIYSIAVPSNDPGVAYAATGLGMLQASNEGASWRILPSAGLPYRAAIKCIAVSPADKNILFAGTSLGLYVSRSGGTAWQKVGNSSMSVDVPSLLFLGKSGQEIMAADNSFGGVFFSSDGGIKWRKIVAPGYESPVCDLAPDPLNPAWIFIGTGTDGVYRLRLEESLTYSKLP
jgi:photosystem II stability/assembly factor-like uncharacterized protein